MGCAPVCSEEKVHAEQLSVLKAVRLELARPGANPTAALDKQTNQRRKTLESGKRASSLSADDEYALHRAIAALEVERDVLQRKKPADGSAAFALLKQDFDGRTKALKKHAEQGKETLSHMFKFCEDAFPDGQELVILVTKLTISYYGAHFISRCG